MNGARAATAMKNTIRDAPNTQFLFFNMRPRVSFLLTGFSVFGGIFFLLIVLQPGIDEEYDYVCDEVNDDERESHKEYGASEHREVSIQD